jgi:excisionase family DNA binding protein
MSVAPMSDAPATTLVLRLTPDGETLVVRLTAKGEGHLALAVARHDRECRRSGKVMPAELSTVVELLADNARQRPPFRADPAPPVDAAAMTFAEAARALGCSTRTVSRMAGDGRLRAVGAGSGRRIPAAEVERFVSVRGRRERSQGADRR